MKLPLRIASGIMMFGEMPRFYINGQIFLSMRRVRLQHSPSAPPGVCPVSPNHQNQMNTFRCQTQALLKTSPRPQQSKVEETTSESRSWSSTPKSPEGLVRRRLDPCPVSSGTPRSTSNLLASQNSPKKQQEDKERHLRMTMSVQRVHCSPGLRAVLRVILNSWPRRRESTTYELG